MQFCPGCQNLLIVGESDSKNLLNFYCQQCERNFTLKDLNIIKDGENYVLYERDLTISKQHLRLIKNACEDVRNPKKKKFCSTCKKEEIAVYIKIPNTLQNVYICCICQEYSY